MPLCSVEEKSSKIFVSLIYVLKHFKSKHQPLNPSPSLPIIPTVTRRSFLGFDWHTKNAERAAWRKWRSERTVAHKAFLELLSEPNNQVPLSLKFDEKIYRQYCEDNNLSLCDALSSLPGLKLSVTVKPYYYEIEHLNPRTPPPLPSPQTLLTSSSPIGQYRSRDHDTGLWLAQTLLTSWGRHWPWTEIVAK